MDCFQEIIVPLAKNKISKAILLLEKHIKQHEELDHLYVYLINNSAYLNRTEKHYGLGNISWELYNISNSEIVKRITELAKEICDYIKENQTYNNYDKKLNQLTSAYATNTQVYNNQRKEITRLKTLIKKELTSIEDGYFILGEWMIAIENTNRKDNWMSWADERKNTWMKVNHFIISDLKLDFYDTKSTKSDEINTPFPINDSISGFYKWTLWHKWLKILKVSWEEVVFILENGIQFEEQKLNYYKKDMRALEEHIIDYLNLKKVSYKKVSYLINALLEELPKIEIKNI